MNGRTNSNNSNTVTILGDGIPLDPPSSFLCEARNSKVDITWVDPKDKYATPEGEQMEDTDQLVSVWSYTKIVRKEGSQPTSPSDGVTVCTNTTRNQYQSTIFEDTGVTNGVTYYYAAYAYNTAGTYSDGAFSDGITPIEWDPVLANNSWEQIDSACTQGVAQSLWDIGDEVNCIINNESAIMMILDFNHDNLADGSGKASITFGTKNVLTTTSKFYSSSKPVGSSRYYPNTVLKSTCDSLYATLAEDIKQYIRSVNIEYCSSTSSSGPGMDTCPTRIMSAYIFPLSVVEYIGESSNSFPYEGKRYPVYSSNASLYKYTSTGEVAFYYTRTIYSNPNSSSTCHYIDPTQFYPDRTNTGISELPLSIAFCIGKSNG